MAGAQSFFKEALEAAEQSNFVSAVSNCVKALSFDYEISPSEYKDIVWVLIKCSWQQEYILPNEVEKLIFYTRRRETARIILKQILTAIRERDFVKATQYHNLAQRERHNFNRYPEVATEMAVGNWSTAQFLSDLRELKLLQKSVEDAWNELSRLKDTLKQLNVTRKKYEQRLEVHFSKKESDDETKLEQQSLDVGDNEQNSTNSEADRFGAFRNVVSPSTNAAGSSRSESLSGGFSQSTKTEEDSSSFVSDLTIEEDDRMRDFELVD